MKMPAAVLLSLLAVATTAGGQSVYKCEEKGKVTYTDRPCSASATASVLPLLVVTAAPAASERALAQAHDERIAKGMSERDREDAAWLKEHERAADREARVRKAIVAHKVIKGMTDAEVRQALGEPDSIDTSESFGSDKETWKYEQDGKSRIVNFKDRQVTTTSARAGTKRKGR